MSAPAFPTQTPESQERFLSTRWILTTLLVLVAAAVMVRLGIWQLDRLQQRRDHNARLSAGMAQAPVDLNAGLPPDLAALEYHSVLVSGTYDFTQEVLLRNQYESGLPGFHILTPLKIKDSQQSVLIDRGWIPLDQGAPEKRSAFQPAGPVSLKGVLRRSQADPSVPAAPAGQARLDAWVVLDLEHIAAQIPYPILPVYVALTPDAAQTALPHLAPLDVDLSEGPHLGYAIQWFIFAVILLGGYPFYVRKQLRPVSKKQK